MIRVVAHHDSRGSRAVHVSSLCIKSVPSTYQRIKVLQIIGYGLCASTIITLNPNFLDQLYESTILILLHLLGFFVIVEICWIIGTFFEAKNSNDCSMCFDHLLFLMNFETMKLLILYHNNGL